MMHGPLRDQDDRSDTAAGNALVAAFERGLAFNFIIVVLAAVAGLACGI
jgi:hypothetical protein